MNPHNYPYAPPVEVGDDLATFMPTPFLRVHNGQLQQWFVASHTENGEKYSKGEWQMVPVTAGMRQ